MCKVICKVLYITNHSAFRKYYMTRNTIYLKHKLREGKPIRTIAKYIIKVIFFEDDKMEKMASIIHGISDGFKSVRGGVIVIVSTYNGEKYLPAQLDSLLVQKDVDLSILVRDDGSTDNTLSILEQYKISYPNIDYYTGDNVGVINSFNDLMRRPELDNYQFIAFCDQDDVWDEDKLLIAVNSIGNETKIPVMYCSNLMLVDSNLNQIKPMRKQLSKYTAYMSMVQNIGTGCTQVFNQAALMEYRKGIGSHMEMHDYWLTLVCMFLGKVIYDNNPHIKYRQHGNNVVGAKDKDVKTAFSNLKLKESTRISMLESFNDCYSLDESDYFIIEPLLHSKGFISRMKLLSSLKYIGITSSVTIGFKIRSMLSRMY